MDSVFFAESSSIEGGSGDVRAVVVDRGAGDIVVPRDEGSTDVASPITATRSMSVVTESPMASDPSADE